MENYDFIVGFTIFGKSAYKTMYRHFSSLENAQRFANNVNIKDNHKIYVDYDLYQKEKEKNEELERKWDEEKYLIKLVENELLGYCQGYEEGFNHNSSAVHQIIKGRESRLYQLEIERLKKIISKLKIENEKLQEENNEHN